VQATEAISVLMSIYKGKERRRGPGVGAGSVEGGSHGVEITDDKGGDGGGGGKGVEGVKKALPMATVFITGMGMYVDELEGTTGDELDNTRGGGHRRRTRDAGQNGNGAAAVGGGEKLVPVGGS